MLSSLRSFVNIKHFMVVYLAGFLVFSSVILSAPERIWHGALIVALYSGFDLVWTYMRRKVWYLPVSSWISGLILALITGPNLSLWLVVVLPLVAVISKQLIWFGKNRQIFNSAVFAIGVVSLLGILSTKLIIDQVPTWWGVAWGPAPLFIIVLAGLLILWRQARWHIAVAFFASYAFFLTLFSLWNGVALADLITLLRFQMIDGTVLFFVTVMLIEPLTSRFRNRKSRIAYGAMAGFFAILITYLSAIGLGSFANVDPLIFGLLLGNIIAGLLFL